jgi:uncharacterized protein (TIGR02145 family)
MAIKIKGNAWVTIPYITIGDQKWMSNNLDTSVYRNGTPIPTEYSNAEWTALSTPAYTSGFGGLYGKLYNWWVIEDGEANHGGICPEGYHVPTDEEWTTLTDYLGGESIAGGKMKAMGERYWNSPNEGADNISNFSAFPAGYRSSGSGNYGSMGYGGYFWSSSEPNSYDAWRRRLDYDISSVSRNDASKRYGFSIRCIGSNTLDINSIFAD